MSLGDIDDRPGSGSVLGRTGPGAAARGPGQRWDAIICGGGASGLCLAAELAGPGGPSRRVLVIDDGEWPAADRRWAFWSADHTEVDDALRHTWTRLRVRAAGRDITSDTAPYSYRLIEGRDLAAVATARAIDGGHDLQHVRGTVEAVWTDHRREHPTAVVRVDGRLLSSSWAFDARPPTGPLPREPVMRFAGHRLDAEADVFDPEVATFLDFRARSCGVVRFGYVLPLSARQALVDVVTICPSGRPADTATSVAQYLSLVLDGIPATVVPTEAGEIPLRFEPPRRGAGRVLAVGRRGGLLRPSTGFAFGSVLADSARIRRSLLESGHPFAGRNGRGAARRRWLDRLLLDAAMHEPAQIESAFAALFTRNPLPSVLAFLDGQTTVRQDAALVRTLPPQAFLRAAVRGLSGR